MKKTATVICAKCGKTKQLYGIRTEKTGGHWYFTWSFPLKADAAKREGYADTVINETPFSSSMLKLHAEKQRAQSRIKRREPIFKRVFMKDLRANSLFYFN